MLPTSFHRPLGSGYLLSQLCRDSDLPERFELLGKRFVKVGDESRQLGRREVPLAAYNSLTNGIMIFCRELSERIEIGQMSPQEAEAYRRSVLYGHEINGHYVLEDTEAASLFTDRVSEPIGCLSFASGKVGLNPVRISYRLAYSGPVALTMKLLTQELFAYDKFSHYVDDLRMERVSVNARADLTSVEEGVDEHSAAVAIRNGPYHQAADEFCKSHCLNWARIVTFDNEKVVGLGPLDFTTIRALNELKTNGSLDLVKFVNREQRGSIERQRKAISEESSLYGFSPMVRERLDRLPLDYTSATVLSENEIRDQVSNTLSLFEDEVVSLSHSRPLAGTARLLLDRLSLVVIDHHGNARIGRYFRDKTLRENRESVALALEIIKLDEIIHNGIYRITKERTLDFKPLITAARKGDPLPQTILKAPLTNAWQEWNLPEQIEALAAPTLRKINVLITS